MAIETTITRPWIKISSMDADDVAERLAGARDRLQEAGETDEGVVRAIEAWANDEPQSALHAVERAVPATRLGRETLELVGRWAEISLGVAS